MPAYENIDDEDFIHYAERVPERPQCVELHNYIDQIRSYIDGEDQIHVPQSHADITAVRNHEGGLRLNRRIRQGASWLSRGQFRFSVKASGPGNTVTQGAALQERFAREGERLFNGKGSLQKARQAANRDLMECGFAVIQQHARRGFYVGALPQLQRIAEGARLDEIMFRRRVDPRSFSWVPDDEDGVGLVVIQGTRHLGEIARTFGLEKAKQITGWFDFGEIDESNPAGWGHDISIETAEIWGADNGALLVTGGDGRSENGFKNVGPDRILDRWQHRDKKPPFYVETYGTYPYHSPLDEMVQLTGSRNYWATMLDIQASGAIFRHWQLIDTAKEEDITSTVIGGESGVQEHLIYDMSKPPPYMGRGKEWRVAPFEFQDVLPRYQQIKDDHESAGEAVARLMGEVVGSDAAVGTVDFLDDAAHREFTEMVHSIQDQTAQRWQDFFGWLKSVHKDVVWVWSQQRDSENDIGSFLSTAVALGANDVVTEFVDATLDTRSRQARLADFRYAMEAISSGFMDYGRAVEQGLIPGVDDAEAELLAIIAAEGERIQAQIELQALAQQAQQNLGPGAAEPPAPRVLEGTRTDPRSLGTRRGPDNASDTGMVPRSDAIRGA